MQAAGIPLSPDPGYRRVMRIRGRYRWGAAVGVVVGLTVVGGSALASRVSHPREVAAFQGYVSTYVGGWANSDDLGGPERDTAWVKAHPQAVLAAGDQSCAWLAQQPAAPTVDPSGRFAFETVLDRYLASPSRTRLGLSSSGEGTVVAGAWAYLCRDDREARTAPRSLEEN